MPVTAGFGTSARRRVLDGEPGTDPVWERVVGPTRTVVLIGGYPPLLASGAAAGEREELLVKEERSAETLRLRPARLPERPTEAFCENSRAA